MFEVCNNVEVSNKGVHGKDKLKDKVSTLLSVISLIWVTIKATGLHFFSAGLTSPIVVGITV